MKVYSMWIVKKDLCTVGIMRLYEHYTAYEY